MKILSREECLQRKDEIPDTTLRNSFWYYLTLVAHLEQQIEWLENGPPVKPVIKREWSKQGLRGQRGERSDD